MKQYIIIEKGGQKWLWHIPEFMSGEGGEEQVYLGSRVTGEVVDESEVYQITQYRPIDTTNSDWQTWVGGVIKWDNVIKTRVAYVDAHPPHDLNGNQ